MNEEAKKEIDVNDILENGKKDGVLGFEDGLDDLDFDDVDKLDKIYDDNLDDSDIPVGEISASEMDKIESDVEKFNAAEDMERILESEGLAIDDPVRMYLKEIGRVELLSPDDEYELAEKMNDESLPDEVRKKAKAR